MKKNSKLTRVLGICIIAVALWWVLGLMGWGFGLIRGSGDIISAERPVSGFDTVRVNAGDTLRIIQDGEEALVIRADDNVMELLTAEVRDNTLVLDTESMKTFINTTIVYELHVADLKQIEVNGSADVSADDLQTDELKIKIDGSGDVAIEDLDSDSFTLEVNGSGDSIVGGSAEQQMININGSGGFDGSQLQGREIDVSIDGSGDVSVIAEDTLTIAINGSGDVSYGGNPDIKTSIDGSGGVEAVGGR